MMESGLKDEITRPKMIRVEDLRRNLSSEFSEHSDIQDPADLEKEHLKVYLRIRPFSGAEIENGESQDCVAIQPPETVLLKGPQSSLSARLSDKSVPITAQRFQFSQVFGPDTTQKEMFDGTVKSLVMDVLEGQNSLVFTYGVTNAGKTFTFLGPDIDPGILPRSLNMIFSSLEGRVFNQMCLKPQRCRDFIRLTKEQQNEEAVSKRNLLRLLRETDAPKNMSCQSSKSDLEDGSALCEISTTVNERSLDLDMNVHTKFSVWVSFCEIYNENIHDLLEQPPSNASRRTNLRLCQDVKGNSFIKDLKWVQVSSADEAFKVMKVGKRNQSISSTKLNLLSSRSHSIFSVRILKVDDVGIPRVESVSELALCDLAGSERCAKTQNKGDRLKEAGNINTSLLSLGKCINALRNNQQARQHVPFRESKLTHYLQGYFSGVGKACMIVNINQCASMYDETLNVLKFSAVAQKVVVLTTKSVPVVVKRSAREVSFIINNADHRELRRSSLVRWDPSLEDVQEDSDIEEEDYDTEEDDEVISEMEDTIQDVEEENKETVVVDKKVYEALQQSVKVLQEHLRMERAAVLSLESHVREEVTKEFSELITQMQEDYSERIARERELMEERCERRLEILKNLVGKTVVEEDCLDSAGAKPEEENHNSLDSMLDSMNSDLAEIRQDAQAAQSCLVTSEPRVSVVVHDLEKKVTELTELLSETQSQLSLQTQELESQCRLSNELEELKKTLDSQRQKELEHIEMCRQKDEMISKLQTDLDQHLESTAQNRIQINSTKKETIHLKSNSTCSEQQPRTETRKRRQEEEGLDDQPPLKKGPLEDLTEQEAIADNGCQDSALLEVKGQPECCFEESRQKDKQITDLEREYHTVEVYIQDLKSELEEKNSQEYIQQEKEGQMGTELAPMAVERSNLKAEVVSMENRHSNTTELLKSAYQEPADAKSRMVKQDSEMAEKHKLIKTLEQKGTLLKQEVETLASLQRDLKHCREELTATRQQCKEKQQESDRKEERLKFLEKQLKELRSNSFFKNRSVDYADLKKVNSDLQAETIAELEEKIKSLLKEKEERVEEIKKREVVLLSQEAGLMNQQNILNDLSANNREFDSKINILVSEKEAELSQREKALESKEVQLLALQKTLKQMQECLEEEEMQAVQEARKREAERRRELLAVAEEAIAQKDAELQKRQEEINRLKEEIKTSKCEVNSLTVDLRRRDDDSSDVREKLSDSKKQIQQVQKEISSMRDSEKSLRLKLSDLEKAKTQLQNEIANRDRTIHLLKAERSSNSKSDEHLMLYQKACKDLQVRERVIEDMRLALTEQEETQTQLDLELENRETHINELAQELVRLKEMIPEQRNRRDSRPLSEDILQARQETAQALESLQLANEKHQAERRKWMEEKLVLIGQAKEAEERRNQDMRRYADDRERHVRQQAEMESLASRLATREKEMESWRRERDTLVSALEIQLQKLIMSNAEKDKQIKILQSSNTPHTPEEVTEDSKIEALQAKLAAKEAEIQKLKEQLSASVTDSSLRRNSSTQTIEAVISDMKPVNTGRTKGSVTSQSSAGSCPIVLDSSEISTETGRRSRFPRPELEISFSPLKPDQFALKRQGEDSSVTVKISRHARKRKSGEMEKDGIECENMRNTRSRNTPHLTPHKKELSNSQESNSGQRGKKDKTLQKIGDFLQGSPTFLGSKAKRIMGLMSGKSPDGGGPSLKLKSKQPKRRHNRLDISSPMDIPAHQIIGRNPKEKESENLIKKRLRTRTGK
ncbi:kinesin-like protein KIF20B isoform X2 [Myxocyprinus asiaticus]|uniref:kinesin-like protein KIF20B isoform X2 n=1 Tax=Myxocyprinus asiaticus TaxID=70543 RepID=UPI002221600D|nr:kinesin-like protein KIF20B isoform X2 [Myxocyprinus asiaticus]